MEVNWVLAQDTFLAQVSELGIGYAACTGSVVHRISANAIRIGRLYHHIAREIRDLTSVGPRAGVIFGKRAVQYYGRAVNPGDDPRNAMKK